MQRHTPLECTLVEQRSSALKPLLPHAYQGGGALQEDEEAHPKQGGGVAFGEGANASGLGVGKADVNPYAEEAGKSAAEAGDVF